MIKLTFDDVINGCARGQGLMGPRKWGLNGPITLSKNIQNTCRLEHSPVGLQEKQAESNDKNFIFAVCILFCAPELINSTS